MRTLLRRCAECTIVFTLQGGGTPSANCRSPSASQASARGTRVFERLFAGGVVKWFQGLGC
ncbi:MAG: hypothetical protein FGF48_01090 [Candidatus Brockarchaeota archaeon]|nr:hypothetical protein [Candidatus Brockarchaeota archaeon]